jgi:hypothetical protein
MLGAGSGPERQWLVVPLVEPHFISSCSFAVFPAEPVRLVATYQPGCNTLTSSISRVSSNAERIVTISTGVLSGSYWHIWVGRGLRDKRAQADGSPEVF